MRDFSFDDTTRSVLEGDESEVVPCSRIIRSAWFALMEKASSLTGKRERHSAEFKAKVALEGMRGEQTAEPLAVRHSLHQTLLNSWTKQTIEGMAVVFNGKAEAAKAARESGINQLLAKIGQLAVERDFL